MFKFSSYVVAGFICVSLFVSATRAQDPATDHNKIECMDWFVGTWESTMQVPDDATGDAAQYRGKSFTITWKNDWAMNRNFIESRLTLRDAESKEVIFDGVDFWGWDPATQKVTFWYFNSMGGHGNGVLRKEGDNKYVLDFHGIDSSAELQATTRVYEVVDENTINMESPERYVGGVKQDAYPKSVYKRVK